MISCPNKNLSEWKNLVEIQGESIAAYLWSRFDTVPSQYYETKYDRATEEQVLNAKPFQVQQDNNTIITAEEASKVNKFPKDKVKEILKRFGKKGGKPNQINQYRYNEVLKIVGDYNKVGKALGLQLISLYKGPDGNYYIRTFSEVDAYFDKFKDVKAALPSTETTVSKALDHIGKSDTPLAKVAQHLFKYANINDAKISVKNSLYLAGSRTATLSSGLFKPGINVIELPSYVSYTTAETIILHEILHALTNNKLKDGSQESEDFNKLYEYAKANMSDVYALSNVDEFIVALFTDAKFILELSKVQSTDTIKYKNFLEEVFDYLLGLLKINKDTDPTLYEQAYSVATNILERAAEQKSISESIASSTGIDISYFDSLSQQNPFEEVLSSPANSGRLPSKNLLKDLKARAKAIAEGRIETTPTTIEPTEVSGLNLDAGESDLKYYEGDITPSENTVFVFGSNPEGRHKGGAAKVAQKVFRLKDGEFKSDNAFGLITKDLMGYGNFNESMLKIGPFGAVYYESEGVRFYSDKLIYKGVYYNKIDDGTTTNGELKEGKYQKATQFERASEGGKWLHKLPKEFIQIKIAEMYEEARNNPGKEYKIAYNDPITKRSLNGYTGIEMLEMFKAAGEIPSNVIFSKKWYDFDRQNTKSKAVVQGGKQYENSTNRSNITQQSNLVNNTKLTNSEETIPTNTINNPNIITVDDGSRFIKQYPIKGTYTFTRDGELQVDENINIQQLLDIREIFSKQVDMDNAKPADYFDDLAANNSNNKYTRETGLGKILITEEQYFTLSNLDNATEDFSTLVFLVQSENKDRFTSVPQIIDEVLKQNVTNIDKNQTNLFEVNTSAQSTNQSKTKGTIPISTEIYKKLGKKTASKNVIIDKVLGRKKSTSNTITAYRTQKNNFLKAFTEDNAIGNPWNSRGYSMFKTESAQESVEEFIAWITGEKHTDILQDYRKTILNNAEKLKGKSILYYEDINAPSHATALDYLLNNPDSPLKNVVVNITKAPNSDLNLTVKNVFTVEPIQPKDTKAKIKASIATQYIGFAEGIQNSSTALYAQQAGKFANTGNYNSNDIIFVSIGGKRGNEITRRAQQDKTIAEATKALDAGATVITDNEEYTANSNYNEGEKRLYASLKSNSNYEYKTMIVNGEKLGTWKKTIPIVENIASVVTKPVVTSPSNIIVTDSLYKNIDTITSDLNKVIKWFKAEYYSFINNNKFKASKVEIKSIFDEVNSILKKPFILNPKIKLYFDTSNIKALNGDTLINTPGLIQALFIGVLESNEDLVKKEHTIKGLELLNNSKLLSTLSKSEIELLKSRTLADLLSLNIIQRGPIEQLLDTETINSSPIKIKKLFTAQTAKDNKGGFEFMLRGLKPKIAIPDLIAGTPANYTVNIGKTVAPDDSGSGEKVNKWIESLIQSAVDNAKYLALGALNLTLDNADIQSALTFLGLSKEGIMNLLTHPEFTAFFNEYALWNDIQAMNSTSIKSFLNSYRGEAGLPGFKPIPLMTSIEALNDLVSSNGTISAQNIDKKYVYHLMNILVSYSEDYGNINNALKATYPIKGKPDTQNGQLKSLLEGYGYKNGTVYSLEADLIEIENWIAKGNSVFSHPIIQDALTENKLFSSKVVGLALPHVREMLKAHILFHKQKFENHLMYSKVVSDIKFTVLNHIDRIAAKTSRAESKLNKALYFAIYNKFFKEALNPDTIQITGGINRSSGTYNKIDIDKITKGEALTITDEEFILHKSEDALKFLEHSANVIRAIKYSERGNTKYEFLNALSIEGSTIKFYGAEKLIGVPSDVFKHSNNFNKLPNELKDMLVKYLMIHKDYGINPAIDSWYPFVNNSYLKDLDKYILSLEILPKSLFTAQEVDNFITKFMLHNVDLVQPFKIKLVTADFETKRKHKVLDINRNMTYKNLRENLPDQISMYKYTKDGATAIPFVPITQEIESKSLLNTKPKDSDVIMLRDNKAEVLGQFRDRYSDILAEIPSEVEYAEQYELYSETTTARENIIAEEVLLKEMEYKEKALNLGHAAQAILDAIKSKKPIWEDEITKRIASENVGREELDLPLTFSKVPLPREIEVYQESSTSISRQLYLYVKNVQDKIDHISNILKNNKNEMELRDGKTYNELLAETSSLKAKNQVEALRFKMIEYWTNERADALNLRDEMLAGIKRSESSELFNQSTALYSDAFYSITTYENEDGDSLLTPKVTLYKKTQYNQAIETVQEEVMDADIINTLTGQSINDAVLRRVSYAPVDSIVNQYALDLNLDDFLFSDGLKLNQRFEQEHVAKAAKAKIESTLTPDEKVAKSTDSTSNDNESICS